MASIERIDRYKNGTLKPRNKCRRWRLYAYCGELDPDTGRYKRRSKNVSGLTEREAMIEANRFEEEIHRVKTSSIYWNELVDRWLEVRENDPTLSPNTLKTDRGLANVMRQLFPSKTRLRDIDVEACDEVLTRLKTKGSPSGHFPLSLRYITTIEVAMSSVFYEAMNENLISDNPMRHVRKRTNAKQHLHENAPTTTQLNELVNMLDPRERHQIGFILSARLGLRRGECCALTWKDVDFDNKVLRVRHAMKISPDYELVIGPPKTPSSVRVLSLTPSMEDALRKRKARQLDDFEASVRIGLLSEIPDMENVLVLADRVNRPISPSSLSTYWAKNRSKYGLNCTLHELRHGFCSMLCECGIHPSVAAACLGHADTTTTLAVYTHVNASQVCDALLISEKRLAPTTE